MLDWLIRTDPDRAGYTIGEVVGEAERDLEIPRNVTARTLREALAFDSQLDVQRDFLDRVLPPRAKRH